LTREKRVTFADLHRQGYTVRAIATELDVDGQPGAAPQPGHG
jgi:IS30 family transposase